MSLITINKAPTARELNWFAALMSAFCGLAGGLIWWHTGAAAVTAVIWSAAGAALGLFLAVPGARRPMYLGWMYAAWPIGWIVSHAVLALVFYLVVTPLGVIMRAAGRDPLQRGGPAAADSYWVKRPPVSDRARYFRQF